MHHRGPAPQPAAPRAAVLRPAAAAGALFAILLGPAARPTRALAQADGQVKRDSTGRDTATYATPALRTLVADAARGNRLPDSLASYRAAVESEIAVSARRENGEEALFGVEQIASTLRWTRSGYYDQHVVGDRSRQTGLSFSVLSAARTGWATPLLYGNRLRLRRDEERRPATTKADRAIDKVEDRIRGGGRSAGDSAKGKRREAATDTVPVIHPLADDRDRYYRYTGGDTVGTLRVPVAGGGTRVIPIVRVHVTPRDVVDGSYAGGRTGFFEGDVDLDAVQHAVVRLRGRFLVAQRPDRSLLARVRRAVGPRAFAFVEYVNAERTSPAGGRYWLPATQRIELQATAPTLGDVRAVVRIVSRFRDVAINDTALAPADLAANADSALWFARRRLTLARGDSLGGYAGWRLPIGEASSAVRADDFNDLTPGLRATTGPPTASVFYPRISDLLHFNRVEGLYLGLGGRVRFRDRAPGLAVAATGGIATAEGTVRGRVEAEQRLGGHTAADPEPGAPNAGGGAAWALVGRAGRTLDITNDFRAPFDSGASIAALLGADDYDYVDRRFATLGVQRVAAGRGSVVRLDAGVVSDAGERARLRHPLYPRSTLYRPNRGVDPGRYARTSLLVQLNPDAAAEFVRPGVGARFYAENGLGDLRYTRVEARISGRHDVFDGSPGRLFGVPLTGSTLALVGRVDAGAVFASRDRGPPPQQLFELGEAQGLLGYGYKEFAGDRAAAARTALLFTGPFLRAPIRVRDFFLPAVAPGFAVTAQLGVADVSGDAARRSVQRLGFRNDTAGVLGSPVYAARPSGGLRASVGAGLTFFGGAVFAGAATVVDRHVDRPRGVRGVLTFNQPL